MERKVQFPPSYCSGICRNSMNDLCVEGCSPKRDMSAFELKKGVNLQDLPPFPLEEFTTAMTPRERQNIMAVYMAKTIDFIQGRKDDSDGNSSVFRKRSPSYSKGSQIDSQGSQINGLQPDTQGNTLHTSGEVYQSEDISLGEVPRGDD